MIQLCWNCQGLGNPVTVQNLREVTRSHNPSLVFLCETHQRKDYVNNLRKQLGYYKGFNVEPIGSAGGLSLWWRPDVSVDVVFPTKNIIDTVITSIDKGTKCRVTYSMAPLTIWIKQTFGVFALLWIGRMTTHGCALVILMSYFGLVRSRGALHEIQTEART